jgi:hypothetical protein
MSEHNLEEMIPAYLGDKPYIFVSYSHKDSEAVKEDLRHMNSEGYHIWYDEGIEIGKDWPDELATAIQNCTQFIVYISGYSIKSEHVKDEIFYALNNNKKIVPIYLENTVLPSGLGLKLGSKQGIMKYQLTGEMYHAYLGKALYPECREREHFIPAKHSAPVQSGDKDGAGQVPDSSVTANAKDISVPDRADKGKPPNAGINTPKRLSPRTIGWLIGSAVLVGIITIAVIITVTNFTPDSGVNLPDSTLQDTNTYDVSSSAEHEGSAAASDGTAADPTAVDTTQDVSAIAAGISDAIETNTMPSQSPQEGLSAFTPDETLEKLLAEVDVSVSVDELAAQIRKKMPVITEVTTLSAIDAKSSRGYATWTARKLMLQNRVAQAKSKIQNVQDQRTVLTENRKRYKTYITELDSFKKAELATRTENIGKLLPYIDAKLAAGGLNAEEKSRISSKRDYLAELENKIKSMVQEVTGLHTRYTDKIAEANKQDTAFETQLKELNTTISEAEKELKGLEAAEEKAIIENTPKYSGGD